MKGEREFPMKTLIVVYSYHHNNTQKVAEVFAKVLDAQIKTPQQINPEELQDYDLVGFGSGIDTGKNYKELLDFADKTTSSHRQESIRILNHWNANRRFRSTTIRRVHKQMSYDP